MASREDIIRMLQADMRDEHGALILYLQHAYMMGEGEEAAEIEGAARDEMRHFRWLAQAITQLGGVPTLDRTEMEIGGAEHKQWMARDVEAEEGAIAAYEQHIDAIDDPRIKAMLERIVTDERAHLDLFASLKSKAEAEEEAGGDESPTPEVNGETGAVLDYATRHEYTVVLQYLFHSFMTPDDEASREWETIAINEMQHLGWFGEMAAESGRFPLFARDPVHRGESTGEMLTADLAAEQAVADAYARHADRFRNNPEHADLVEILDRAGANEQYHLRVFKMMAERARAEQAPYQRPGIGPTQPGAEGSPTDNTEDAESSAGTPKTGFTVGSLKGS